MDGTSKGLVQAQPQEGNSAEALVEEEEDEQRLNKKDIQGWKWLHYTRGMRTPNTDLLLARVHWAWIQCPKELPVYVCHLPYKRIHMFVREVTYIHWYVCVHALPLPKYICIFVREVMCGSVVGRCHGIVLLTKGKFCLGTPPEEALFGLPPSGVP